ncbi:unnamed protein product [Rotaria sp. Silwood1]|nr:unnamed protein product [Rotaria sp. Silwood1]
MIKKDGTTKSIQDDLDETIDSNDFICSTDLNENPFEDKKDELMDIVTPDIIDFAYSQLEALKVLNEVFHLLKIEPVNDIRHTNKLREKLNSVNIALNNLCETILKSKTTMIQNPNESVSMNIKLNDCQSLLNGIKQFFFLSKKEQQIQLLTIAPPDWGRKKIEFYFGCTEHQSKQALILRKSYGVLARPVFFSGNSPIQKATIDQVVQFYEDDKITRQSSNKKDRIKVNGEEKIFRFMEMTIKEAYLLFKDENPTIRIGHSKFYALKPKWIKIKSPYLNCLCTYHENFYLLLESWNKQSDTKWNIEQLIKSLLCTSSTEQCYSQKCSNCQDKFPSCILTKTDSEYSNVEDDEISWFNWVRTLGKIHLQEIHSDESTLIGTIDDQWPVLLYHHFLKDQQKSYIDSIKKQSNDNDYVVVTCDFSENYILVAQREVQSAHWSTQQASLFTIHIKIGKSQANLAIISNYLNHDTAFVYYCQKMITDFIKNNFPLVKKVIYH